MSNQVAEVAREVGEKLKAAKFPFRVVYAPERTDRSDMSNPVILFMRDRMNGEDIEPPKGQQANGRLVLNRKTGVEVRIYACSSLPSARAQDHEELADYLIDAVLVALEEVCKEGRFSPFEYGEARFLYPSELVFDDNEPEKYRGVVFVLRLKIGRGVVKRDYLKQVRPTTTVSEVGSQVEVRQNDEDDPEVVPIGTQPDP
jgi:hypothetical protein